MPIKIIILINAAATQTPNYSTTWGVSCLKNAQKCLGEVKKTMEERIITQKMRNELSSNPQRETGMRESEGKISKHLTQMKKE